jgi:FMN phosphatase YigB (HAD superfamily)
MEKVIFFDVANTLLYKPDLYATMLNVFNQFSIAVDRDELEKKHKLLSEIILFPDKTSADFYQHFNKELLLLLGIKPEEALLNEIFKSCTYLPWQPFDDTKVIHQIVSRKGILSNWDKSLKSKLENYFNLSFDWVLGSEDKGVRKPELRFFELMITESKVTPEQIVFVGDSLKLDIIPALSLGINAVLIDRLHLYPNANVPVIHSMESILNFID